MDHSTWKFSFFMTIYFSTWKRNFFLFHSNGVKIRHEKEPSQKRPPGKDDSDSSMNRSEPSLTFLWINLLIFAFHILILRFSHFYGKIFIFFYFAVQLFILFFSREVLRFRYVQLSINVKILILTLILMLKYCIILTIIWIKSRKHF